MANEKIVQIPLANVARVELVTEENTPNTTLNLKDIQMCQNML